jgi:hypothetical protein
MLMAGRRGQKMSAMLGLYMLMAARAGEDIPCDPGERLATDSEEWR